MVQRRLRSEILTDEIIVYSSMYKAAKTFNQQSRLISAYDGKIWRNRYAIKVLTESDLNLDTCSYTYLYQDF